jgi:hypothetical protein
MESGRAERIARTSKPTRLNPVEQRSAREERIGLNEAVFREVNERIEEVAETFEIEAQPLDLICECGDAKCVQPLSMTRAEYEHIRSDPQTFAVHPGHELPDVEEVVERRKGYNIVRKGKGVQAKVAEQTDPPS